MIRDSIYWKGKILSYILDQGPADWTVTVRQKQTSISHWCSWELFQWQWGNLAIASVNQNQTALQNMVAKYGCHSIRKGPLRKWLNTIECRYNAVQFITILYMVLRWQEQKLSRSSNSQRKRNQGRAMGCLLWGFGNKNHCVITAPHCTWNSFTRGLYPNTKQSTSKPRAYF